MDEPAKPEAVITQPGEFMTTTVPGKKLQLVSNEELEGFFDDDDDTCDLSEAEASARARRREEIHDFLILC